jgi:DNA end-binding protein Ku
VNVNHIHIGRRAALFVKRPPAGNVSPARRGAAGLHLGAERRGCGTKRGAFQPQKFEDHYEDALRELLKKKQNGEKIEAPKEARPSNVINLMDALRRSLKNDDSGPTPVASRRGAAKKSRKKPAGQTEMLLPIEGKKQVRHHTKKAARSSRRQKAG